MNKEPAQPPWRPPGFESGWSSTAPVNAVTPERVPLRPQGSIPVIVRLLWTTHEELVPARAVRWTPEHVMVSIAPIGGPDGARELYVWLRSDDVYRTVPRRPAA